MFIWVWVTAILNRSSTCSDTFTRYTQFACVFIVGAAFAAKKLMDVKLFVNISFLDFLKHFKNSNPEFGILHLCTDNIKE